MKAASFANWRSAAAFGGTTSSMKFSCSTRRP